MFLRSLAVVLALCCTVYAESDGLPTVIREHMMDESEEYCEMMIVECHERYAAFVSGEIPHHAYTKSEIRNMCKMSHSFKDCTEEVRMNNCSNVQRLTIKGIQEAQDYICEDGIDVYKGDYMKLETEVVELENHICVDHYLIGATHHLREFMYMDTLETPSDMEEKDELLADIKTEKEACCGHYYGYLMCAEKVVERQVDEDFMEYQYEMLSHYYEPHMERCSCKIGKGFSTVFINAMIITAALFAFIFGLATCCGCIDCCGEKMKLCRRRCRQMCYCCYDFEEDDEYFERKYEAKLTNIYGEDNVAFDNDNRKPSQA